MSTDGMTLGRLAAADLSARLNSREGLRVRTGPFVFAVRSPLEEVREGLALHYGQHAVLDHGPSSFSDFHVSVRRPRGLRQLLRPQVEFLLDDRSPFQPLPGHQGYAMLEWGMNWAISAHAHQYVIMHAAVLERGGQALVMPAPAGSGKSTLCAALALRGWRLLSDELALLCPRQGLLQPLARPVSLKNQSIDVIRRFDKQAVIGRAVAETSKGVVAHLSPPPAAVAESHQPARASWVVLPRYQAGAPTQLSPISRPAAFMALQRQTFNYDLHGLVAFQALCAMVSGCSCFDFTYSRLDEALSTFEGLAVQE